MPFKTNGMHLAVRIKIKLYDNETNDKQADWNDKYPVGEATHLHNHQACGCAAGNGSSAQKANAYALSRYMRKAAHKGSLRYFHNL